MNNYSLTEGAPRWSKVLLIISLITSTVGFFSVLSYFIIPESLFCSDLYKTLTYADCLDNYQGIILVSSIVLFSISFFSVVGLAFLIREIRKMIWKLTKIFVLPIVILIIASTIELSQSCSDWLCIRLFPYLLFISSVLYGIIFVSIVWSALLSKKHRKKIVVGLAILILGLIWGSLETIDWYEKHENIHNRRSEESCRNVWNQRKEDWCIKLVAIEKRDLELCQTITYADIKEYCLRTTERLISEDEDVSKVEN